MRKSSLLAFIALFSFSAFSASATQIEVLQNNVSLGFIDAYSGTTTAANNWTMNVGATVGPASRDDRGNIFFFEGTDGLSFFVGWNRRFGSSGPNGFANWDITLTGNAANAGVRFGDESTELNETSPSSNVFLGDWGWHHNYADGGAIGDLVGNAWQITIDPSNYTQIADLDAFSADGTSIDLTLNTSHDIVLRVADVPDGGTTALMLGLGLIGLAGTKSKLRRA